MGLPVRFQQTPLTVTRALPSEEIALPPPVAVVASIPVTESVVGAVGADAVVVFPDMTILFMARYLLALVHHAYNRTVRVCPPLTVMFGEKLIFWPPVFVAFPELMSETGEALVDDEFVGGVVPSVAVPIFVEVTKPSVE